MLDNNLLYAAQVVGVIIGGAFNKNANPLDRVGFALKLAGMFILLSASIYLETPTRNEDAYSLSLSIITTGLVGFGTAYFCGGRLLYLGWRRWIAFVMIAPFANVALPLVLLIANKTKATEIADS